MARMTAARAAVEILKREGVTSAWVGLRHSQRRLGCKAIRVTDPADLGAAFEQARKLAAEFQVPVVVEAILERVTNISMSGTNDIGNVVEFEEIATEPEHAPTSI